MGCGASSLQPTPSASTEERPAYPQNPVADKLDGAIALKREQLKFLAAHGTGEADEAAYIMQLRTDLADLEDAVKRLRLRDLNTQPLESPPDTPPDLAEGQAELAGERLSPKHSHDRSALDPIKAPLHVPDHGDAFAGVMVDSSSLDHAQRIAARNVEAYRQRLQAHEVPSIPTSVADAYRVDQVRELVSRAEREAKFAADARTQHERVGVFVRVLPGAPPPAVLAEPLDKSAGSLIMLDRVLEEHGRAAGLREGLVLHSIDLGDGSGLKNVIGRDYVQVITEVEQVLQDAANTNARIANELLEQADEAETTDALAMLQEAARLQPLNTTIREEVEQMAALKREEDETLALEAEAEAQLDAEASSPRKKKKARKQKNRNREPEPEPERELEPARIAAPLCRAVAVAMAQSRSLHFMFVSAEVVREVLDAERVEAERRAAVAAAAAAKAEQDRADSVARQQEAERKRRAQVKADAAAAKAAAEEVRLKAMRDIEVDVQASLPEPKFRPGDMVLLASGATLTDEQLEKGCLRGEIRDGSVVTPAVVAKVSSVSNPWEIPQRMQRQLTTRRATLRELTRENLMSATHSVKAEIDVLETELREMLALIAVDGKSVVYAVDASAGRRGWYREEQLAKATREQAEESRRREKEAEEKAIELLGFISMSGTDQAGSLHGEAHAQLNRLGMATPASFLSSSARKLSEAAAKERAQNAITVLSVSGAPTGEVGRNVRELLLREELAAEQEGMGLSIRLTADYGTGGGTGGKAELEAALHSLSQRKKAAEKWATVEHPKKAEWAAGKWAMAVRSVRGRRHNRTKGTSVTTGASDASGVTEMPILDELTLREGEVVRLTVGLPNKFWSGVTMKGAVGDFPASEMRILEKAIARRDFSPLPNAPTALYTKFAEGAKLVIVESPPTAKWWQGFVLDDSEQHVLEADSGGQVAVKLLPREAVTKESAAAFEKLVPRARRWGETPSGAAQRAALQAAHDRESERWALSTAGVLAYAGKRGWGHDDEDMEAAAARALEVLSTEGGGKLRPAARILEISAGGTGLFRISQAVHEAGLDGGQVAAAEQRLAEQRAGIEALEAKQKEFEVRGEFDAASKAALERKRRLEAQQEEWVHGCEGGQTCGYLLDENSVLSARATLSVNAQAHTAQRELAAAAVERKEIEQTALFDIAEIRLLLDRDKVVLGRESDASHIQQQKKLRKAQREAEAVIAAAEEAVATRISNVEADLAANISEIERVCEEERQAAATAAMAYIEMNNPKADEAAKVAAEEEQARIAAEQAKKAEEQATREEEARRQKEAQVAARKAKRQQEMAEFVAGEQAQTGIR